VANGLDQQVNWATNTIATQLHRTAPIYIKHYIDIFIKRLFLDRMGEIENGWMRKMKAGSRGDTPLLWW
jgi:hypothetical protein